MRSFRSRDQLESFLWTAEPVRNDACITAQSLHSELEQRAHLNMRHLPPRNDSLQPILERPLRFGFEALGKGRRSDRGSIKSRHESEKIFAVIWRLRKTLATPASVSKSANLRSAGVDSSGTPSRSLAKPGRRPSENPLSLQSGKTAASSSFDAD